VGKPPRLAVGMLYLPLSMSYYKRVECFLKKESRERVEENDTISVISDWNLGRISFLSFYFNLDFLGSNLGAKKI